MARMIPSIVRDFHDSQGEKRVFDALRSLTDSITVIHSFRWLHPGKQRSVYSAVGTQGEGDFVVFDHSRGIMVIEVKGGEIRCENGEWRQRNRKTGVEFPISPEVQASSTCHRIREELQARISASSSLLFCYAIWFPDGVPDRKKLPMNCPTEIVLDEEDLSNPEGGIGRAYAYWHATLPSRKGVSDDVGKKILDLLAPTFDIVPSLRRSFEERDAQLVQLTHEQARIIDFLDEQRQAAVHGAAGTGKTLIALEKARRLASCDEPVLFLCYNAALRAHLQQHQEHQNVRFLNFHGLAREIHGPRGSLDAAEQTLLSHLMEDGPLPYMHLIVDEAQDYKDEWLDFLYHRFRDTTFYVFYDRNQYVQGGNREWLDALPCRLVLTRNCRNTNEVARVAYRAAGIRVPRTLGVNGPKPMLHTVETETLSALTTKSLLEAAREKTKTAPHDLAVLTLDALPDDSPFRTMRPKGLRTSPNPRDGYVTVTTARRFKGLEATFVVIPDVDFSQATDADWRRRLYVACSRARQVVHLITTSTQQNIGPAVKVFSGTDKARTNWPTLVRYLGAQLNHGGTDDPFN